MFISPAFAQEALEAVPEEGSFLISILPLILVFFVFYFMVIRPQNKRIKEHRSMVDTLKKGDKVVTGGGLIGKVKSTKNEDEVTIELSKGVEVTAVRSTIMTLRD